MGERMQSEEGLPDKRTDLKENEDSCKEVTFNLKEKGWMGFYW